MTVEQRDNEEKALIALLWGQKGWERYKDLTHHGFSIERLFDFLRNKKKAEDNP